MMEKSAIDSKIFKILNNINVDDSKPIYQSIQALKKSNMVRHHYVNTPLLNYSKWGIENDCSYFETNLISDFYKKTDKNNNDTNSHDTSNPITKGDKTDQYNIEKGYSPRHVNFHEVALAIFRDSIFEQSKKYSIQNEKYLEKTDLPLDWLSVNKNQEHTKEADYLKISVEHYWKLNRYKETKPEDDKLKMLGITKSIYETRGYRKSDEKEVETTQIEKIEFKSTQKGDKLTVGIVNLKLNKKHIEQSYLQNPVFDDIRQGKLNALRNMVNKERELDVLIFPEVSIPHSQIGELCKYAKEKNIMIIFGLEHWICHNIAFNFLVTLVPFQLSNPEESGGTRTEVLPLIRLKNHYSHHEIETLKRYRYNIPQQFPARYHLLNWRGVRLSVFNCFELADIDHRSLLRSEVDVLFASVYNQDTLYFSNIAETVVRDLHCFYVQANDSAYGDSRVTRPMKNELMNQIRVKGGKNDTILVDSLNIDELRKFQIQEYHNSHLHEQEVFKPKPPGFNVKQVMKRWHKDLNEQ